MTANIHSIYIEKYNKIESLIKKIKDAPSDANMKYLEDMVEDSSIKNKLYLCRITRNYIQHNTDYKEFINISDAQLKFLDEIEDLVLGKIEKVEDIAIPVKKYKIKYIDEKTIDSFTEFVKTKNNYFTILNKDDTLLGVLSIANIATLLIQQIKKTDKLESIDKKIYNSNKNVYKFVKKGSLYEEAINLFKEDTNTKIVFVTENGKSTGKIIGIIERKLN